MRVNPNNPQFGNWARRAVSLYIACFCVLGLAAAGHAQTVDRNTALFSEATDALKRGTFEQAIQGFEQLSDLGARDPAASFNRALAYIQRAETPKRRAGDLGQAAAALREAVLSGAGPESEQLLLKVRERIAHERARRNQPPVEAEAPLSWALVRALPEDVWAWLALTGSLVLTAGLWLRKARAETPLRLAGQIAAGIGTGLLLIFGSCAAGAQHLRRTVHEAVVIVPDTPLLDAQGKAVRARTVGADADEIPEGASVYLLESQGNLARVRWGSAEAWVSAHQLRRVEGG
jgi:hypothetical protein